MRDDDAQRSHPSTSTQATGPGPAHVGEDCEPRRLLEVAIDCVTAAGALLKARFDAPREIQRKGTGRIDLVTDADKASEALILVKLASAFPHHRVVAEESGARPGTGPVTWYVDPLDGTLNYSHRLPFYCVSVAAFGPTGTGTGTGGEALLAAAIFDPTRGELFSALQGGGAWLDGRPIHASSPAALEDALLCTGFPYDIHEHPELPLGLFGRLARSAQGMRRLGSAALDMAWVAAGRMDGFFELGLKPWDTAAAALVLAEAGAVVTRLDGAPFDVGCGDVLAAPPSIAPTLQAECRAFLESQRWRPHAYGG